MTDGATGRSSLHVGGGLHLRAQRPSRANCEGILDAKEAGCIVARDGLLGGRRYETFAKLDRWKRHSRSRFPFLRSITLAMENHKDCTLDEYLAIFREYSSEYLGATLDFGNNFAMLDDPMSMAEAVAPWVKATHVKDNGSPAV